MPPELIRPLILLLTFIAVLLGAEVLIGWIRTRTVVGHAVNKRLRMIAEGISREAVTARLRLDIRAATFFPAPFDRLERRLARMLHAAGLNYQPVIVVGLMAFMVILIVVVGTILFGGGGRVMVPGAFVMILVFALIAAIGLPMLVVSQLSERRRKKVEAQFPVALDVFVRGLRAGHPISAALGLLTTEMSDPIGSEFGLVIDEVTYGAELNDALQAMADRWNLPDMQMFVVCLSVQRETGGNLAEILENLAKVIRDRAAMYMTVRALSSEGRMTAWMLTILPVVAFAGLFILNPGFYLDVADDPAFIPGFTSLIVLYFIGYVSLRRMVNLEV